MLALACQPSPRRIRAAAICDDAPLEGDAGRFVVLGEPRTVVICPREELICGPECEVFLGYECPAGSSYDAIQLADADEEEPVGADGGVDASATYDQDAALTDTDGGMDGGASEGGADTAADGGAWVEQRDAGTPERPATESGPRPSARSLSCGSDSCAPTCPLAVWDSAVAAYGHIRVVRLPPRESVAREPSAPTHRVVLRDATPVEKGSSLLEEPSGCLLGF